MEVPVPDLLRRHQIHQAGYLSSHPGRRLPVELCVKEPTLEELARAVCICQLRNIIEPHKAYSRDYLAMGRLKVELLLENGKPVHSTIASSILYPIQKTNC